PAAAASAAWVLGELHARDRAPAIVAAMRRGTLPAPAALHALAGAGTSESLPVVLEFVSDANAAVHDRALDAAGALLDPSVPDGRATEPLSAALRDSRLGPSERAAIARLLGRTGAARAAPVLAGLARAKGATVRLAAIDALGTLGTVAATRPADLEPVLDALADPDPGVRLHAAVALSEAGGPQARDLLLAKLDDDEVDRAALLTALGGILARSPSPAAIARLTRELELTAGPGRDSVIEALGRAKAPAALDALTTLAAGSDVADARAAASLLAAHADDPRAVQVARGLLGHRDATVRAQAAWALGTLGGKDDVRPLGALFHGEPDEAIDAAGAIGRIAGRAGDPAVATPLCSLTTDPRAYVRASAYSGLAIGRARCGDGSGERRALTDDPSEAVRGAAALALARTPKGDADARALVRCAAEDRAGTVASRCRAANAQPPSGHPRAVTVYVVPDVASTPQAGASYVLVFGDGELRAGAADRRGAVFDPLAPDGELTLLRTNER
ncbi:MAG TPA: HEAT repeat domain-containing protein, partial [Polyangiaceae bacterium]